MWTESTDMQQCTATEQQVLAAIVPDEMLQFLAEMVSFQSLADNETPAQRHIAAKMRAFGFETDVWDIDFATLRRHPAFSWEVERSTGLGVVGTIGADRGGKSLLLNGHIDVVPAGDRANWHSDPYQATVRDGRMYGRGALDMKAGLVAALWAAHAIKSSGVTLRGRLYVASVIGEEDGGCGTLATIVRGYIADAAIIPEPTRLAIAPAQAGAHNVRIRVPGLSAHGCYREEGVSAIEKYMLIHTALVQLEETRNARMRHPLFAQYRLPYPLSIGTVHAGNWPSSVAEELVAEGRYGIGIGEDSTAARQELEHAVAAAAQLDPWLREHPPIVEWWGGTFEPAECDINHPIVGILSAAHQTTTSGPAPAIEGMTYGADMRLLVHQGGMPTIMYGPGDVRLAHKPDENVPITDIITVARSLALTAMRYIGYDD
jgi:acetylornithine deacetylase